MSLPATDCFIKKCECGRLLRKEQLHEEVECQCGEVWEGSMNDRHLKHE